MKYFFIIISFYFSAPYAFSAETPTHPPAASISSSDYSSIVQILGAFAVSTAVLLVYEILLQQQRNVQKYGFCVCCKNDIRWNGVTLPCGHNFHGACVEKIRQAVNQARQKARSLIPDEYTRDIFAKTIQSGIWAGLKYACPTCNALIHPKP